MLDYTKYFSLYGEGYYEQYAEWYVEGYIIRYNEEFDERYNEEFDERYDEEFDERYYEKYDEGCYKEYSEGYNEYKKAYDTAKECVAQPYNMAGQSGDGLEKLYEDLYGPYGYYPMRPLFQMYPDIDKTVYPICPMYPISNTYPINVLKPIYRGYPINYKNNR